MADVVRVTLLVTQGGGGQGGGAVRTLQLQAPAPSVGGCAPMQVDGEPVGGQQGAGDQVWVKLRLQVVSWLGIGSSSMVSVTIVSIIASFWSAS